MEQPEGPADRPGALALPRIGSGSPEGAAPGAPGTPGTPGRARPATPLGQPGPSTIARAWRQHLSRAEWDVEVKAIYNHLQDFARRAARQEARNIQASARIDALQNHCEQDLATKAAFQFCSEQVAREVKACRRDFDEALEELRGEAATVTGLEALRSEHSVRLEALDVGLAAAGREAETLHEAVRAASDFGQANYATKADLSDAQGQLRELCDQLAEAHRLHDGSLVQHAGVHEQMRDDHRVLQQKHEDLVLSTSVTSSCLDCLKVDLADTMRFCHEELGTRIALEQTERLAAEANRNAETAAAELATLRQEFEHERGLLRRTVYSHNGTFSEIHSSLADVFQASKVKGDLAERCEAVDQGLSKLQRSTGERSDKQRKDLETLHKEHLSLEASHLELKKELLDHVKRLEMASEATRQYSTNFTFQQLDHAISLSKTLEGIEKSGQDKLRYQTQ